MIATNSFGDSAASDPTSSFVAGNAPAAPSITSVTRGNNSATVAFTSNGDGGDPITDYRVTCTSSNGGISRSKTGATSPITVSVAVERTDVHVQGRSPANSIANSLPSAASSAFVAATSPAAPTIMGITRGDNSVAVAFTANGTGGSAITGYTATCTSSDGGTTQSASGVASPITVSSLTNSDTYTCTAVATNAVGDSAASVCLELVRRGHPPAGTEHLGRDARGATRSPSRSRPTGTAATPSPPTP